MPLEPDPPPTTGLPTADLRRHLADAVLPNAAFLLGYKAFGVHEGVIAALCAALVLVVARLIARQRLTVVMAAFGLVAVHATAVLITGHGRDFFLPWLALSAGLLAVFGVSLLRRRPVSRGLARFENLRDALGPHLRVTALWSALWALNLAVGIPLYLADQVVGLGLAHFLLGAPTFALLGLASWRSLRTPVPTPLELPRETAGNHENRTSTRSA